MGETDFTYYSGGLLFQNIDTKVSAFLKWAVPSPDYGNMTINDLSLLSGNSTKTYTFKSSDYYKIDKGFNKVTFKFCGLKNNPCEIDMVQDQGRIWIGEAISSIDSIYIQ